MCTRNREFDMVCRIQRMEDKLLRSKNIYDQMEIQSILRGYRMELQKIQWGKQKERGF